MENSKDEKATIGTTSLEQNNIFHQKITDPFKKMIREALKEQHKILLKYKQEIEAWDADAKIKFIKTFGFENEKARLWILNGIKKELALNETIPLDNFIKLDENVYASVNSTDLDHKINIGRKFSKAPLTGQDSQVVTLCHEMSHFDDILGTKDLGEKNPKQYAKKLAKLKDERTMQNSYNFELYFI
ncbi:M35 family metallo-endopeptidase [Trabulsiella odontotermitis]|uniref:M35 family metallo-endopeptidase n=1 Tax=Trabulsiella odontotermitis TaxID=379893 RepID=UPI0024B70808|nr:M35 family metallo-endopeptidase [Trabulsiella odontotermitis]WHP31569.1 M35 family metallo-endopeptidase [Trabulsiella odontotermitis]